MRFGEAEWAQSAEGHHAHHTTHTLKPGKMPRSTQSPCLSVLCTCDFHSLTSDQRNVTEYGGAEIHGVHDLNHNKREERERSYPYCSPTYPITIHPHPSTLPTTSHQPLCAHIPHIPHISYLPYCAHPQLRDTHITRIESAHVCTGRGETRIYGIHTGIQTVP